MALNSAAKAEIMGAHRVSETDTGSPEVQVALLTTRIKELTEHFKIHKKDLHSKRGLLFLVNRRKKLLKYVKRKNSERYQQIIKRLGLRDTY